MKAKAPAAKGGREREARALDLRDQGLSFRKIGTFLGSSKDPSVPVTCERARQIVNRAIRRKRKERADALRASGHGDQDAWDLAVLEVDGLLPFTVTRSDRSSPRVMYGTTVEAVEKEARAEVNPECPPERIPVFVVEPRISSPAWGGPWA